MSKDLTVWDTYQGHYGGLFSKESSECYHCGRVIYRNGSWSVAQIIPSSQEGNYDLPNIRVSCMACVSDSIDQIPFDFANSRGYTMSPAYYEGLRNKADCDAFFKKRLSSSSSCVMM